MINYSRQNKITSFKTLDKIWILMNKFSLWKEKSWSWNWTKFRLSCKKESYWKEPLKLDNIEGNKKIEKIETNQLSTIEDKWINTDFIDILSIKDNGFIQF